MSNKQSTGSSGGGGVKGSGGNSGGAKASGGSGVGTVAMEAGVAKGTGQARREILPAEVGLMPLQRNDDAITPMSVFEVRGRCKLRN